MTGRKFQPMPNEGGSLPSSTPKVNPFERHYRPAELAEFWGFGVDLIRIWFEDEPGVLIEDHPATLHKRGYRSMRIPASVAERVYRRHLAKNLPKAA